MKQSTDIELTCGTCGAVVRTSERGPRGGSGCWPAAGWHLRRRRPNVRARVQEGQWMLAGCGVPTAQEPAQEDAGPPVARVKQVPGTFADSKAWALVLDVGGQISPACTSATELYGWMIRDGWTLAGFGEDGCGFYTQTRAT